LEISKNLKGKAKLLNYQNSGDTIYGEKSQVVGYCAIAFIK
jgi:AmmeMemoRadiSam system protein B